MDKSDSAGVWSRNLDGFTREQMRKGLLLLAKCDDDYMPNPPRCAHFIRMANKYSEYKRPGSNYGDPEIANRELAKCKELYGI